MMSKWISFLLYRSPAFLHGMGDEKGPVPGDVLRLAPATERSFDRRDGGRTMSRSILGEVVSGWPPESSVSSSSCSIVQHTSTDTDERVDGNVYLIHHVEILLQGREGDRAKVLHQDVDERLQERERKEGIDCDLKEVT